MMFCNCLIYSVHWSCTGGCGICKKLCEHSGFHCVGDCCRNDCRVSDGKVFEKIHIRDTSKVMIFLCVSFILVTLEDQLADVIPFASLIAVMAVGITLQKKRKRVAERLSVKFNKLWVVSEIMLFVLVGATVNIKYALSAGFAAVVLIFGVLAFRMAGVFFCLLKPV